MRQRVDSQTLLKEFCETISDEYPDLTYGQIREVAYSPWLFLKDHMENQELGTVRFKYFGTFRVFKGRAEGLLKRLEIQFKRKTIDDKDYFRIKKLIESYLNGLDD